MRETKQMIATAALLHAAWVTFWCPCRRLCSCHKKDFLISVGAATALVLHDNMS